MEWKQLQSNIARCRTVMNAFLWALDKLNFPLGKEHICWLKLLSLRILIRVVLQSKTKSFELQQFLGQQHFNMVRADLLLMHPGWQVGFLLHFAFFFFFVWINPFILASFLCPSSRQTRSWPSLVSPPQDLLEAHKLWHQFFLPWTQHTYSPQKEERVSTETASKKLQVSFWPIQHHFTYYLSSLLRFKMCNSPITPHVCFINFFWSFAVFLFLNKVSLMHKLTFECHQIYHQL